MDVDVVGLLRDHIVHLGVVGTLAVYPFVYTFLVNTPLSSEFRMILPPVRVMVDLLYFSLFAMSFDFISGYTGYLSFGHAAFAGTGAYFVVLAANGKVPLLGPETPFMLLLVLAALLAALIAAVIGSVSFRLTGVYFAMITLGFSEVMYVFVQNWDYVGSSPRDGAYVTGKTEGFAVGVPGVDALNLQIGRLTGDTIALFAPMTGKFPVIGTMTVPVSVVDALLGVAVGVAVWVVLERARRGAGLEALHPSLSAIDPGRLEPRTAGFATPAAAALVALVVALVASGLTPGQEAAAALGGEDATYHELGGTEVSFYMVGAIALACYFAMQRIVHSPFGRVMVAIRENEERARAVGYDTFRYKMAAFVMSAFFAGIAGGLFAAFARSVAPGNTFFFLVTGFALLAAIIGGFGTLSGPLYGYGFILFVGHVLTKDAGGLLPYLRENLAEGTMSSELVGGVTVQEFTETFLNGHADLYIGVIFVLFVLYVPEGLLGTARDRLGGPVADELPPRVRALALTVVDRADDAVARYRQ